MNEQPINLLEPKNNPLLPTPPTVKRRFFTIPVVLGLITLVYLLATIVLPGLTLSRTFASGNIFAQLKHLTLGGDKNAANLDERINIAILGMGGEHHDGGLLTDTIIIASYDPDTKRAALLSIPRDLYVPYPDGSWRKINAAYAYGVYETPAKDGVATSISMLSTLLGTELDYYVTVDFSGFEELVDAVGGVDVYVERAFSDYKYPLNETRTEHISFEEGLQHMDGNMALKFARSRMGTNGEGSDFARAKRQQKILIALKDKILQGQTLLNPLALNRLTAGLANNIATNIESWQLLKFYQIAKDINAEQIVRVNLSDAPDSILHSGVSPEGAYILQPKNGNYNLLKDVMSQLFTNSELVQEAVRIEIQNGTDVAGLATVKANELAKLGYTIVHFSNAANRQQDKTIIYDLTGGARPTALAALKLQLNATVYTSVPEWLKNAGGGLIAEQPAQPKAQSDAEFLIILGENSTSPTN